MSICYCDPNPSWKPATRLIASISQGNPAIVATTFNHGYQTGTVVRLIIPEACGMQEANQLTGTITVIGGALFTINIDTTTFSQFDIPTSAPVKLNTCAWVVPIGEANSTITEAVQNIIPTGINPDDDILYSLEGNVGPEVFSDPIGNINLVGSTFLTISGNPATNTFTLAGGLAPGTTDHAVQVGNGSGGVNSIALGPDGNLLMGFTGADPVWNTITTTGTIFSFTPGAGTFAIDTSAATIADYGTVRYATNVEMLAGASSTIGVTPAGSSVKLGSQTANALPIGNSSTAALSWTNALVNGQVLIGHTGFTPQLANLSAGSGMSIINGAGTITLTSVFAWHEITAATVALDSNAGYVMNRATLITASLPTTAAQGSRIRILGKGTGLYKITQSAGQVIYGGSESTTPGATGYLISIRQYDVIELLCITANTEFLIARCSGNVDLF